MSASWRALALRARPGGPDFGRWVTPEELNVAPGLLGKPLARPQRRLLAMAVDLAAIGLVSSLTNFWLLAACGLGAAERARVRRKGPSPWRTVAAWALVALLAYAGVQEVVDTLRGDGHDSPAREAAADDDADDDAVIAALLAPAPGASAAHGIAAPASVASAASASAAESTAALQAQVQRLQRQLAKERQAAEEAAKAENWRERLRRLGLDFGVSYGWSLVYFTMLPTWWRGQTLGKRLFGLRVVEITGKPMTPLLSFKRFGGYLAGMATGGLGLVQLLWDPNRQGLQDKAAHTVVIDERQPARPPAGDTPPAPTAPTDPTPPLIP
ncbi:RDD family protein [Ideonella sp.]|uniref:RDD family protein n=1 Tax=Ideonella sp. TaxID=1929293 RepID=UPI0035AD8D32